MVYASKIYFAWSSMGFRLYIGWCHLRPFIHTSAFCSFLSRNVKLVLFLGYENEDHQCTCMYYGIVCSLHGDVQLLLFRLSFSLHDLCVSLPWPAALCISVRYMWKHLCQWSNVLRLTVCWKSLLHSFYYFASRTLKKINAWRSILLTFLIKRYSYMYRWKL